MKPSPLIHLIPTLTTIILLHPISTVRSSTHINPTANTTFIRTSCATTLYPEVCFTTLSCYADTVNNDLSLLARAAISVSLSRARNISSFLSNHNVSESSPDDPLATSAVHTCSEVFSDAVDNILESLGQMCRIGEGSGESVRFQLSNVQTWMSAALTNVDTCRDGFEGVKDEQTKADVCERTRTVEEDTSNALALVNSYASTVNQ